MLGPSCWAMKKRVKKTGVGVEIEIVERGKEGDNREKGRGGLGRRVGQESQMKKSTVKMKVMVKKMWKKM